MGILISQGGPVISTAELKPTVCITHVYGVELNLTATWRGNCMADTYCIPNTTLCIPRGDYRRIIVSIVDDAGAAVDVSGFSSVEYGIATNVDAVPVISKSLGSGIVLGGDNASVVITLTEADTKLIPQEYVYHELRLTNGTEGQTVMAGTLRSSDTIFGTD